MMKIDFKKCQAEISSLREQLAQRHNSDTNGLGRNDLLIHRLHLGNANQDSAADDQTTSQFRMKPRNERSDSLDLSGPRSPTDDVEWGFNDDDIVPSPG
jgi:hypothetical protein